MRSACLDEAKYWLLLSNFMSPSVQILSRLRLRLEMTLSMSSLLAFRLSRVLHIKEIPMGVTGKKDRKALYKMASELLSEQLEK